MAEPTVKVRIQADTSDAETKLSRFGTFVRGNVVATFGDLARAARAAFDAIRDSASLESQRAALEANLAAQGQAFDAFIAKLDQVAQAQVSTGDLIRTSSEAILRGIPAEEIANILETARTTSIATGQSVADAFEALARGVATGSGELLRAQGIVISSADAFEAMAASIGKTADQLTISERQQAIYNAVVEQGRENTERFGGAQTDMGKIVQQTSAQLENFREVSGKVITVLSVLASSALTGAAAGFVFLARALAEVNGFLASVWVNLGIGGERMVELESASKRAAAQFGVLGRQLHEAEINLFNLAKEQAKVVLGMDATKKAAAGVSSIIPPLDDALSKATVSTIEFSEANDQLRDSFDSAGESAQRASIQFIAAAAASGITGTSAQNPQLTLAQRQAIFGNQANQRRGDLAAAPGGPLFPGLSGTAGTFTLNTGRAVVDSRGRVTFL